MPATIYYDSDADLALLRGKTIAILGYGSQGHAHAQNLRDSGCEVIVGQRPGGKNYELAVSHGFEPLALDEATRRADMINVLNAFDKNDGVVRFVNLGSTTPITTAVDAATGKIIYRQNKFVILDLDSTNGTGVNGEAVTEADLHDEDEIIMGGSRYIFRITSR